MNGYLAAGLGQGVEKGTAKIDAYDKEQHRRKTVAIELDQRNQQLQSNLATQEQARTQSASKFQAYEQALQRQGQALKDLDMRYEAGQIQDGMRKFMATGDVTYLNNLLTNPKTAQRFGVESVSQPNRQDPKIIQQAKTAISKLKEAKDAQGPTTQGGETAQENYLFATDENVESYLSNPLIVQDNKGNLIDMTDLIIKTGSFKGMTPAEGKNFMYQQAGLSDPNLNANFVKSQAGGAGTKEYKHSAMAIYNQAIENLVARGEEPTRANIDQEVRAIKGDIDAPDSGDTPKGVAAYRGMTSFLKGKGVSLEPTKIREGYSKLNTEDQGEANAFAKVYFAESKQKLMEPGILARHIKTLQDLDMTPANLDNAVKDAAGVGDVAINAMKKFFTSGAGIEFDRVFKQTFNNVLMTGAKGHISKAELENLQKAYGGLSESNKAVFNNFRSMVEAMQSQVEAYKSVNPIAAEILYGKELAAYEAVMTGMNQLGVSSGAGGTATGAYDKGIPTGSSAPGSPRNTRTFKGQ